MAYRRRFVVFISLLAFSSTAANPSQLYLEIDGYVRAEPMPARAYINGFRGSLSKGTDAITHNLVEIGVRKGPWAIGLQERYGYKLLASRDFIEGYHVLKNGGELDIGRHYQFQLDAWHLAARGVRIARKMELNHEPTKVTVDMEIGLTWLDGDAFLDGSLFGAGLPKASNRLEFDTKIDYQYSRDELFDRSVSAPSGRGLTTDLRVEFSFGEKLHGRLKFDGVTGFVDWQRAPITVATARSNRGGARLGGGVNPLVTGNESFRDFRQKLPFRMQGQVNWHRNPKLHSGLLIQYDAMELHTGFVGGFQFSKNLRTELLVWPRLGALGFALHHPNLTLRATADNSSLRNIRFSVIEATVRVDF